ncbi:Zinc-regulated transporter-like protein 3 [Elsinoe fawcettii]|nr:Zinc-regulated transporter-like protein 3 [Elsinoe fawcettii]
MGLSNDTRGLIMTSISGVACVLGAAIICADIIVRQFPGKKNFRIQDSDAFLSASLSLSFGVMLFSALYKMLPSAKNSLYESGMNPKAAAWVLIICFIGGAVGIQIVSRILHHYIPSHVVDCEHTHDEEDQKNHSHSHSPSRKFRRSKSSKKKPHSRSEPWPPSGPQNEDDQSYFGNARERSFEPTQEVSREDTFMTAQTSRPTLRSQISRTLSKLSTAPTDGCKCDTKGPCHGFTDPCGKDCFKIVQTRGSFSSDSPKLAKKTPKSKIDQFQFPARHTHHAGDRPHETTPLLADIRESEHSARNSPENQTPQNESAIEVVEHSDDSKPVSDATTLTPYDHAVMHRHKSSAVSDGSSDEPHQQHHHHVPTNAFLSIGLQTSIAIALHKLPEGFITYATNHANPRLGFSVFLALFIHNITEGFAMALPLYLALQSRWKAMAWSALLGGFSQPLGAGIAALWFKIAGHTNMAPGEGVYGGMFAVTSGIMTSVALSLFSESLDLTHSRGLCMVFAFVGMGIMGVSSALTA